jgi:hypothetical protein
MVSAGSACVLTHVPDYRWELMKWAWIQYVSVLLIFIYVISWIKELAYRNHLVSALPQPVRVHCAQHSVVNGTLKVHDD